MNNVNGRLAGESEYNYTKRVYELRKRKLNEALATLKNDPDSLAAKGRVTIRQRKVNELQHAYNSLMELNGGRRKTYRRKRTHKKRTLRRHH